MQYPYQNLLIGTNQGTVALDANVQAVVNAINTNSIIPYGDYGGPNVYYFQTLILKPFCNLLFLKSYILQVYSKEQYKASVYSKKQHF